MPQTMAVSVLGQAQHGGRKLLLQLCTRHLFLIPPECKPVILVNVSFEKPFWGETLLIQWPRRPGFWRRPDKILPVVLGWLSADIHSPEQLAQRSSWSRHATQHTVLTVRPCAVAGSLPCRFSANALYKCTAKSLPSICRIERQRSRSSVVKCLHVDLGPFHRFGRLPYSSSDATDAISSLSRSQFGASVSSMLTTCGQRGGRQTAGGA
jgi:hypothetical protein